MHYLNEVCFDKGMIRGYDSSGNANQLHSITANNSSELQV